MKKVMLLIILVIPFIFSSYYAVAEDTPLEVYKPKIVIDAVLTHDSQLGAQPGNFVINYGEDWIGGVQPSDIEINNDGNIYIFDMGNDRIQKFNIDGQFIGIIPVKECYVVDYNDTPHPLHHYKKEFEIDKDGNFIILDGGHTKDRGEEIVKIDKNGNELERYSLTSLKKTNPEIFMDGIKGMKLDENGMPYFESEYFDESTREIRLKGITKINKGTMNIETINKKEKGSTKTDNKGRKYEVDNLNQNERIISRIENGKTINKFRIKTNIKIVGLRILGEDLYGNTFISVSGCGTFKYDEKGTLVARIPDTGEYWWKEGNILPLKYNMEESELIDSKGNFYLARLLEKHGKLQVIRWSKQE